MYIFIVMRQYFHSHAHLPSSSRTRILSYKYYKHQNHMMVMRVAHPKEETLPSGPMEGFGWMIVQKKILHWAPYLDEIMSHGGGEVHRRTDDGSR